MANTTNFNWETPDDTDLVKDGALAIRTLGSSIDTSLVDLKGGTTDQVLAKNSNTDLDFKWVAAGGGATTFPTFSAKRGSSQTISANTWTKIAFNSESWDTASAYDATTNYRFTPQTAGYYQVNLGIWANTNYPTTAFGAIYKNGSEWRFFNLGINGCLVYLNGSTDYIEGYFYSTSTAIQVESYFDAVGIRS